MAIFISKREMKRYILLPLLMVFVIDTEAEHLTAVRRHVSLNLQTVFMERDIARCVLRPYEFYLTTTFAILKCMQKYVSHCLMTPVKK